MTENKSLSTIIRDRLELLELAITEMEEDGEVSSELSKFLDNAEIELHDKLNAYAWVKSQLETMVQSNIEQKNILNDINKGLRNKTTILLERLHYYLKDEKVNTSAYKFKPYMKQKRTVDGSKLTTDDKVAVVEMPYSVYSRLMSYLDSAGETTDYPVKFKNPNVTDLPKGHPAIMTSLTPSVTISKIGKELADVQE